MSTLPIDLSQADNVPAQTSVYCRPIYQLGANGEDITIKLQNRLINLTLTDNRGFEADQLDITLDDSDGLLDLPAIGATLALSLGWQHSGLVDKGSYTVDEIEHSGTPDLLTIRARSADLRGSLTEQKERSWHNKTVSAIVTTIAGEHELEPIISNSLASEKVDHIDQANESDASFLSRLAEQFDAISTVKQGKLLFIKAGDATSANGEPLPPVTITRAVGDQHRFTLADRGNYTAVKAFYYDRGKAKKGYVIVDKNTPKPTEKKKTGKRRKGKNQTDKPAKTVKPIEPSADSTKVLRHTYANEANAWRGARAAFDKLKRGTAEFSITLAYGRPELFPEVPVTVEGFKPVIDSTGWLLTKVTHNLGDGGYTMQVEMELQQNG